MRIIRVLLLTIGIGVIYFPCFSQVVPNDRTQAGLNGRVRTVEEYNIVSMKQEHKKPHTGFHEVIVFDTILNKKGQIQQINQRKEVIDTNWIETVFEEIADTLFYCFTEYTLDGFIKKRVLVNNHGRIHENSETTISHNCKMEMRTYSMEKGITTQWHYFYSSGAGNSQLEQIVVTQYKNQGQGELVEIIEYEYETVGAICRERHISPAGETTRVLKYESGMLTDFAIGADTNIHYLYDADSRLSGVEFFDANFNLIRVDNYEYIPTGVRLTSTAAGENQDTAKKQSSIVTYEEEYDGAGNWIYRIIDGKEIIKREIKYFNK